MTAAVTVTIAGEAFEEVVRVIMGHDLQNIASTFEVTIVDEARLRNALIARFRRRMAERLGRSGRSGDHRHHLHASRARLAIRA